MEQLATQKKVSIIRLYFTGLSYDEIAVKTGISKGSITNIIIDLKAGRFPEASTIGEQVDLLRELSVDLKRSNLTSGHCVIGIAVLNQIKGCGLDPADIDRWSLILKSAGNADQIPEFIRLVYDIQDVMKKTGMGLEELHDNVQALEKKAAKLEPIIKQLEERQMEVKQLTKRRDDLVPVVNKLDQKYGLLNPRVKDLEKREGELLRRIKDQQDTIEEAEANLSALSCEKQDTVQKADAALASLGKEKQQLLEAGFSPEALAEFNDRMRAIAAHHHIAVGVLSERLLHELETLDKGLGLETLVESRKAELKKF